MNLNHQIAPVPPSLNVWRKTNEIITVLNWLMSMYGEVSTDGNSQLIIEPGARGPKFKVNNQWSNQQPWATDPDGNPTGWLKSIVVDPNYNVPTDPDFGLFDESWMWSGPVSANPPIPWFLDPDSPPNQAQWITVKSGTNAGGGYYWGTGTIAGGGALPNQQAKVETAAAQSFSPATGAFITFSTTPDFNTDNAFTITSSGLTVPATGLYLCGYELQWLLGNSNAPLGNRFGELYLNGSTVISYAGEVGTSTVNYNTTCQNTSLNFLNKGDALSVFGMQNSQGVQSASAKLWSARLI
jgi:hypothetical protein